jgi:glycosyltransferase involved in cell wall biosynthesis
MNYSIVICAHNAESRIVDTLSCIARLSYDQRRFEVVIIDNNSSDNTTEVAIDFWSHSDCNASFRAIHEPRLGLSYARQKGIDEARGRYILFCDDDNHLRSDYLRKADERFARIGNKYIIGGAGIPLLDTSDPSEVCKIYSFGHMLAVGAQSSESMDVTVSKGWLYGAGLIVPRAAFEELSAAGFKSMLTDRKGSSLATGGDVEICYALTLLGWRLFSSLDLIFYHEIAKSRLEASYLDRLMASNKAARAALIHYQLLRTKSSKIKHFSIRDYHSILMFYAKQAIVLKPRGWINLLAACCYTFLSVKLTCSDLPFYLLQSRTH